MVVPTRSPVGDLSEIAHRTSIPAGDPRGGYALIEAMAALTITLLLLVLTYPMVPPSTTPARLLALVSSTVSLLRDARTAALLANRPVTARFDPGRRRLLSGANAVVIPADVAFSLMTGGNCPADGDISEILFRPDGSNCGGVLSFAKGVRVLRARVNWADGNIDVVQDR